MFPDFPKWLAHSISSSARPWWGNLDPEEFPDLPPIAPVALLVGQLIPTSSSTLNHDQTRNISESKYYYTIVLNSIRNLQILVCHSIHSFHHGFWVCLCPPFRLPFPFPSGRHRAAVVHHGQGAGWHAEDSEQQRDAAARWWEPVMGVGDTIKLGWKINVGNFF